MPGRLSKYSRTPDFANTALLIPGWQHYHAIDASENRASPDRSVCMHASLKPVLKMHAYIQICQDWRGFQRHRWHDNVAIPVLTTLCLQNQESGNICSIFRA